ncbi:hypothetical protein HOV93_41480 [Planctomycetes bacterium FF15]|uniref:Uncharacterized protein n=1 Tax=Bremerella alba TaxID=980252 RepID=A0A7V8V8K3_9BACT|nr:hypothetical protein [Bremerella alba]
MIMAWRFDSDKRNEVIACISPDKFVAPKHCTQFSPSARMTRYPFRFWSILEEEQVTSGAIPLRLTTFPHAINQAESSKRRWKVKCHQRPSLHDGSLVTLWLFA